ncbi:MAG: SDR family NAD(P)-dependent oxidoreductase [Rhodospirillales bacterium]|nr:MAG: SDR family NAD(P)-dependent oxidoreductase [Rhodospirillales bacterium]
MTEPTSILITGASSGIGAALARLYAAPGVTLTLGGRDADRLDRVAADCRTRGAAVGVACVDVTEAEPIARWVAAADAAAPLDLVIANAGISGGTLGGDESRQQAAKIFDTNVGGVVHTVHPAAERMRLRRRGQIAIMSSLAGFRGMPGAPAYSASKAAARSYGEALRGSLRRDNVSVSVICPGFVRTPMTDVNGFPMPLLIDADVAAQIIRRGLARNRARIAFPLRLYAAVRLLGALPPAWTDPLLARMPEKG